MKYHFFFFNLKTGNLNFKFQIYAQTLQDAIFDTAFIVSISNCKYLSTKWTFYLFTFLSVSFYFLRK